MSSLCSLSRGINLALPREIMQRRVPRDDVRQETSNYSSDIVYGYLMGYTDVVAKDTVKETAILVLGLVVALLPFLGFPRSWKTIFFVLSGLAIASLAFLVRERRGKGFSRAGRRTDVYVENGVNVASRPKEFDTAHPTRVEIRPHEENRQQAP